MFARVPRRIIVAVTMAETSTIFAEIEAVLADEADLGLDRLEHTLTSGYAVALRLEARRSRLERRIADVAMRLGGASDDGAGAAEIADLARDLSAADSELTRLRKLLGALRERAVAARAAA